MPKLIVGLCLFLFLFSCGSDKDNEIANNADIEFQFEIVDSLLVDYLGTPLMCDFSPNKQYILFFNNRNTEFIITSGAGEIISQFTKEGDIPDNPGTLADRPIFFDNNTVLAHGQKGIWAYNLEGKNVWTIEREQPLGYWYSKSYGRSMYLMSPEHLFAVINYDQLVINASEDSLYENQHALKIVNQKTKTVKPVIPLESNSRYLDGKGYQSSSMLPINHALGNIMLISYSKDDIIYLYEWVNQSFQLADTFSLNIEPFYLDKGKERNSFKNQRGVSSFDKVGEAEIRNAWLLDDKKVLIEYNPGIKESERKEPKMEKTGESSFRVVYPDNIPPDQFQLYREGKKYGKPFNSALALSSLLYIDGDFIWFKKNNMALDVEDDYSVFYKTKLTAQQ
jgi:hypothetical protein